MRKPQSTAAGAAIDSGRSAFTLMELLIAVGALAFVAVGVAAIFEATGRTIRAGRRVSEFSSYANLIEQRMRADFSHMTRDGFLIIRNQYADRDGNNNIQLPGFGQTPTSTDDAIPLSADDEHPRPRRVDEILFFAKGNFQTLRAPLDPRMIAKSGAAAIYYGHGERRIKDPDANAGYLMPEPYDNVQSGGTSSQHGWESNARLGLEANNNPNQYASDWILLRRVTLLCPPQTQPRYKNAAQMPSLLSSGAGLNQTPDSDIQVALQPAESSIFRALSATFPATIPLTVRPSNSGQNPRTDSGIIDIATTDLSEIRAIVTTSKFGSPANFYDPNANQERSGNSDLNHPGPDGELVIGTATPTDPTLQNQQHWMDDALPAWSFGPANGQDRVRCEPAPTNLMGLVDPNSMTYVPGTLERAYRTSDQMMLSASNFLPHCTEFIVEWSFGDTDGAGQPKWHGLERRANPQSGSQLVSQPYDDRTTLPLAQQQRFGVQVPRVDPTATPAIYVVPSVLVHGGNPPYSASDPLTSYFGYFDPTFNPDLQSLSPPNDPPNYGLGDPGDARDPTLPWPWPRMIRITLSLADPNDPSIEQSFQFVFDVPEGTP